MKFIINITFFNIYLFNCYLSADRVYLESLFADGAKFSAQEIPQDIHFIWVGPEAVRPDYQQNITETVQNFPDFIVHLWTSHAEKEQFIENIENLHIHYADELYSILEKYWIDKDCPVSFLSLIKEEIEDGFYQSAKDMLELVILFEYGGIYVDCDIKCKDRIRELTGASAYGCYSTMVTPQIIVSAKGGDLPKAALAFLGFQKMAFDLLNNSGLDLKDIKRKHGACADVLLSGAVIYYANRALGIGATDANCHIESFLFTCKKCQKNVFKSHDMLLQNNACLLSYFELLETPSTYKNNSVLPRIYYDFTVKNNFQAFIWLMKGKSRFINCPSSSH